MPIKEMLFSYAKKLAKPWKKPSKKSNDATPICKLCFQKIESNSFHSLLHKPALCASCYHELEPKFIRFKIDGIKATAIYEYQQAVQSLLFQFKGCYDIELSSTFFDYPKSYLKHRYFNYFLIPAPSSSSQDLTRGFNHVEEMGKSLGLPIIHALLKNSDIKQTTLDAEGRKEVAKKIFWNPKVDICGKKILFLDDVYTTGSTVKACLALIKKHHPSHLEALLMSKTRNQKRGGKRKNVKSWAND